MSLTLTGQSAQIKWPWVLGRLNATRHFLWVYVTATLILNTWTSGSNWYFELKISEIWENENWPCLKFQSHSSRNIPNGKLLLQNVNHDIYINLIVMGLYSHGFADLSLHPFQKRQNCLSKSHEISPFSSLLDGLPPLLFSLPCLKCG